MNTLFKFSGLSFLFLLCGLLYFPFLGEIHLFDWDETLIASVSKEMFSRDEVLQPWLNGQFFLEMPPFFNWLQLLSFKYLGINEYAARFPNALCAILIAMTLYKNGKRIYSTSFGMIWAVVYMSMLLPQIYHRSGLAEPWFCFFIYLSLYNLSRVIEARQERGEKFYKRRDIFSNLFFSVFAAAGAILTKGIEGYMVIILTYWAVFVFSSAKYGFGYSSIIRWTIYLLLLLSVWIGIEYKWHGKEYLVQFFSYQWQDLNIHKASWTHRISFQFIILFIGCFPASALAFNSIQKKTYESTIQKIFRLTMISCLIIVLVITSLFKSKIAHYSVLAYFPISFLAAYSIRYIVEEKHRFKPWTILMLVLGSLLWTIGLTIVPLIKANFDFIKNYIHEDTLYLVLSTRYPWEILEIVFGIFFFLIFIISAILFIKKRNQIGMMVLIFGCMIVSNMVIVYYLPKIEQLTQGSTVEFIQNNRNEKAIYHYYNGKSFISKFYSDSALTYPFLFTFDSIQQYKKNHTPQYLTIKSSDTTHLNTHRKHFQHLYTQGIYSFYKLKH